MAWSRTWITEQEYRLFGLNLLSLKVSFFGVSNFLLIIALDYLPL